MPLFSRFSLFAVVIFSAFFLAECTVPTRSARPRESSQPVRVLLYRGPLLPLSAPQFQFEPEAGPASSGAGRFLPPSAGLFKPAGGVFAFSGKHYDGQLQILRQNNVFLYINVVAVDDYLTSVVAHEMSPSWPLEALKAQAVLARTYLYNKIRQGGPFDIAAGTVNQAYGGKKKGDQRARSAVEQTATVVVTYHGSLAEVYYHSSSGGQTASAAEVWKNDRPYLVSRRSPFAEAAPVFRWRVSIPSREFARRLGLPDVRKVKVLERSRSRRASVVGVKSSAGIVRVSAADLRESLGSTLIKSTLFDLRLVGDRVEIFGRGYGHGVGLAQWDARSMAERHGFGYRRILAFFFPGTDLEFYRGQKIRRG